MRQTKPATLLRLDRSMIFKWLKGNKDRPETKTNDTGRGPSSPDLQQQSDGLIENAVALATGLEMTEAFYPDHDPIDYYGNGGFRFGSMSHQGALLFLPSGIRRWDVDERPTLESLTALMGEKEDIELLLLGTGKSLMMPDPGFSSAIRAMGIKLDIMDTGAAVRTLNILLSEDRAVAAALLPVN